VRIKGIFVGNQSHCPPRTQLGRKMGLEILHTPEIPPQLWDEFVSSSEWGHILQSSPWAELKRHFGWDVARILVMRDGRPLAGAQLLFRPLVPGLGRPTIAYVPKGPVLPPRQSEIGQALLEAIHREAQARGAAFLKVEPDWPCHQENETILRRWGFRPGEAIQPRSTIIIDLTPSQEEIMAQMKQKTRYNIRLASRKGVRVREGSEADVPLFYELLKVTSQRDRFGIRSLDYYEIAYRLFASSGNAVLFLAEYQGEVLAGLMAFSWGNRAWYMYGASSSRHRNRMPNHLLQWRAICWAKEKGCLSYDLWGIPDEVGQNPERYQKGVPNRTGGLWGVYRFKRGFGGKVVRYVGAWDYIYSRPWYVLYRAAFALLK